MSLFGAFWDKDPNPVGESQFGNNKGLFFNLKDYEEKKDKAIKDITEEPDKAKGAVDLRNYVIKGQRDVIMWKLYNDQMKLNPKMTRQGFAEWLTTKFGESVKFTGEGVSKIFQTAQQFLDQPDPQLEKKTAVDKWKDKAVSEKDVL